MCLRPAAVLLQLPCAHDDHLQAFDFPEQPTYDRVVAVLSLNLLQTPSGEGREAAP
ncbi:protein of unknown function [Ralstonia solanacearum CFBP2957]|nr:protein of unknown function [Ralstonia solanacearum CFBP2957]